MKWKKTLGEKNGFAISKWMVNPIFDCWGTDGLGIKLYSTKEKAISAGKRYLKKMKKNGFEV